MLIKNRKGERGERGVWVGVWVFGGWGGTLTSSWKDWTGFYGCIK